MWSWGWWWWWGWGWGCFRSLFRLRLWKGGISSVCLEKSRLFARQASSRCRGNGCSFQAPPKTEFSTTSGKVWDSHVEFIASAEQDRTALVSPCCIIVCAWVCPCAAAVAFSGSNRTRFKRLRARLRGYFRPPAPPSASLACLLEGSLGPRPPQPSTRQSLGIGFSFYVFLPFAVTKMSPLAVTKNKKLGSRKNGRNNARAAG